MFIFKMNSIFQFISLFLFLFPFSFLSIPTEDVYNGQVTYSPSQVPIDTEYLPIGGLFSITNSDGSISSKGIQRTEAFKCAIKLLNQENFIPNVEILWYIQDDKTSAEYGLSQSLAFIQDGIATVVGAAPSSVTEPVSRLMSGFQVPMISYASTAALLSDRNVYPNFFRTIASDNGQVKAMIEACKELDWSLVAAASSDDNYGTGGLNDFVASALENDIIVPCSFVISSSDVEQTSKDFSECVKNSGTNVVMLFMNEIVSTTVISIMNKTNAFTDSMTFLASDSWAVDDAIDYGVTNFSPSFQPKDLIGSLGFIQQPGNLTWFSDCFGQLNPENTNYDEFLIFWETRFTCKLQGDYPVCPSDQSKRSSSVNCLCDGSENLENDTPNSKVSFVYDSVYAIVNAFKTIRDDCSSIKSSNMCNISDVYNYEFQKVIQELSFNGKTGFVSFDGSDRSVVKFDVIQFDGKIWKQIGYLDQESNGEIVFDWDNVKWKTEDNSIPVSKVHPSYTDFDDSVAIFVEIISIIMILFAFGTIILFVVKKDSPVVKRSSPLFCHFILIGLILIWISLWLWMGDPSDSLCSAKLWVGLVGYSVVMGNLFAKTYRVWKIFNQPGMKVVAIPDTELIMYSGVILLVEIILLGILMSDAPKVKVTISSTSELDQYYECKCSDTDFQTIMIWVFFGYNVFLVGTGSMMAYLTRSVISHFNESKYIALSMYNITVCMVIVSPIYFTVEDVEGKEERLFAIRSIATLFASIITYLSLFGPKIHAIFSGEVKISETGSG